MTRCTTRDCKTIITPCAIGKQRRRQGLRPAASHRPSPCRAGSSCAGVKLGGMVPRVEKGTHRRSTRGMSAGEQVGVAKEGRKSQNAERKQSCSLGRAVQAWGGDGRRSDAATSPSWSNGPAAEAREMLYSQRPPSSFAASSHTGWMPLCKGVSKGVKEEHWGWVWGAVPL